jgi:protocatechuate 3,4-dioxygenase beta subunit
MLVHITVAVSLLALPSAAQGERHCTCVPVSDTERTRAGGNEEVELHLSGAVRQLVGTIHGPTDEPLAGVLVEVFDASNVGGHRLGGRPGAEPKVPRLAACVTGEDGCYSFDDVPDGHYEVRCSRRGGWNVLRVLVQLDSGARDESESLRLQMPLAH